MNKTILQRIGLGVVLAGTVGSSIVLGTGTAEAAPGSTVSVRCVGVAAGAQRDATAQSANENCKTDVSRQARRLTSELIERTERSQGGGVQYTGNFTCAPFKAKVDYVRAAPGLYSAVAKGRTSCVINLQRTR